MAKPTVGIYGIHDSYPDGDIAFAHDHAIAIMENGHVSSYLQLERRTRIKHDNSMHLHVFDLLKEKGLSKKDYDLIWTDNILGRSFISTDGKIRMEANYNEKLFNAPEKARFWNIDRAQDAYIINHELAHIYSQLPFCENFKENSLLIHYDGGASLSNFSAWIFKDGTLKPVEHHWKLKKLSSIYNANALVFRLMSADFKTQHGVPGKFMGYASYGKSNPEIKEWLLNNDLFESIWSSPSVFFESAKHNFGVRTETFDLQDPFLQDVAASLQQLWIDKLIDELHRLRGLTKCKTLYYSGGSALNIVGNKAIIRSGLFEDIYIPPCTEDSGLALGAASALEYKKNGFITKHSPYLNNWGIESYQTKIHVPTIRKVASLIAKGKVIGICNEYGEVGPRALGNRSIVSKADSKELAALVSIEKKKREWFRPLAPMMLNEAFNYFTGLEANYLNKFMLLEHQILPHKQEEIAGAVHIDGSARIQIIHKKEDNPFIFELLNILKTEFNIRSIINTSFNIKGEPIVHNHVDATKTAKNMSLDAIVLNGVLEKIS